MRQAEGCTASSFTYLLLQGGQLCTTCLHPDTGRRCTQMGSCSARRRHLTFLPREEGHPRSQLPSGLWTFNSCHQTLPSSVSQHFSVSGHQQSPFFKIQTTSLSNQHFKNLNYLKETP